MNKEMQNHAWYYLYYDAPILFLHLNAQGKIKDVNHFTKNRIVSDFQGKKFQDILLQFSENIDLDELRADSSQMHLMHVTTQTELPEAFWIRCMPLDNETLIFGNLDVDETGKLRKELISLNNQMNNLTRELQKKNHELQELNQLKNQFLGMAAHDLRKPVGAVLNYTDFLLAEAQDNLNEEHYSFLKTIHGSTDLMQKVIDDFLDISIIESGQLELDYELTSVLEPVEKSVSLNSLLARKKGIELNAISEEDLVPITMDSLKIEQVLNNLISNAIEHSPQNSEVEIRLWKDGEKIKMAVKDSGPGCSPEDRENLFTPFTRGAVQKNSSGIKSSGLGLAISKKIVQAHGGQIWIEENQDKGTSFVFSLPNHTEKGEKNE